MSDNNAITPFEEKPLLNIFTTDEDKNGTDLLEMSNFFDFFVENYGENIHTNHQWQEIAVDFSTMFGRFAAAIKAGFDINDMGVMIADYSHFSKEIVDGLKKGIYHIGESKEVAGNMRPAILDKDEHIVKWFTMKKAVNPKELLSDVSSLSMQNSLRQISFELKGISQDLKYEIEFTRRQALSLPFIHARSKFLNAINNPENRAKYLEESETYLLEGLDSLYADIETEVKRLCDSDLKPNQNKIKEFFIGNLKYADDILGRINEDMLMIPKYVAVRLYTLQYLGRYEDAKAVIEQYRFHLDKLANMKLPGSEYTAAEVIHELYPYHKDNRDFWLEMPQQTISALDSLRLLIEPGDNEVFLIDAEVGDAPMEDGTEATDETEAKETGDKDEQ